MGLSVSAEVLRLTLREPFRIARSDHDAGHAVTTVVIELRDDRHPGVVGIGEGYPDRFYGETAATIVAVLPFLVEAVGEPELTADGLARAGDDLRRAIAHNGGAKCALDIALHDLAGKVAGVPVHRLIGLSDEIPPTDFTIGIDEPAVVAERAARAARFPALKIKVGGECRPRDAPRGPRRLRRPDPGRREHRLDARRRDRAAARARRPGGRARRAAVPGAQPRRPAPAPGASRRCRSSPTRAR